MYQPFHDYVQCTRIVIENRVLSGTSPFTFGSNYVMLSTQTNVALLCTPIIKDVALAGLNSATHKESIESPQPPRDYSNKSVKGYSQFQVNGQMLARKDNAYQQPLKVS